MTTLKLQAACRMCSVRHDALFQDREKGYHSVYAHYPDTHHADRPDDLRCLCVLNRKGRHDMQVQSIRLRGTEASFDEELGSDVTSNSRMNPGLGPDSTESRHIGACIPLLS